jgi:hypothetical protein
MANLLDRIDAEFKAINKKDSKLRSLVAKVRANKATQRDIADIADRIGANSAVAMKNVLRLDDLPEGLSEKVYKEVVTPAINKTFDGVNNNAVRQLRAEDKKAGRNIAIRQAGSEERINQLGQKMIGIESQDTLNNLIDSDVAVLPRKNYDDFQKTNAELRAELGYDQIIIRTYDDVGLHGKHEPCMFCISREGTWDYEEAKSNGVFARHPGCGCHIEMITSDNTRRTQTQWQRSVDANGNEIRGTGNQWT